MQMHAIGLANSALPMCAGTPKYTHALAWGIPTVSINVRRAAGSGKQCQLSSLLWKSRHACHHLTDRAVRVLRTQRTRDVGEPRAEHENMHPVIGRAAPARQGLQPG